MELSIPTNRGGISGESSGVRVIWSRGLVESGQGSNRTSEVSFASHSLVNTFWVRQTDRQGLTTVLVLVPSILPVSIYRARHLDWGKKKSDL